MSKLDQLTRQLARTSVKPEIKTSSTNVFMEAVDKAIAEQAEAAITAAQKAQAKAEDRADAMQAQLDDLHKEMAKMQREHDSRVEAVRKEAMGMVEAKESAHRATMHQLRGELTAMQNKLAEECAARAAAEATVKAMAKNHENMERMMNKPAPAPAPVVVPPQAPRPAPTMTVAVSQRDQNGRIVAMTIKPTP